MNGEQHKTCCSCQRQLNETSANIGQIPFFRAPFPGLRFCLEAEKRSYSQIINMSNDESICYMFGQATRLSTPLVS